MAHTHLVLGRSVGCCREQVAGVARLRLACCDVDGNHDDCFEEPGDFAEVEIE
jgi:hypothetical protein